MDVEASLSVWLLVFAIGFCSLPSVTSKSSTGGLYSLAAIDKKCKLFFELPQNSAKMKIFLQWPDDYKLEVSKLRMLPWSTSEEKKRLLKETTTLEISLTTNCEYKSWADTSLCILFSVYLKNVKTIQFMYHMRKIANLAGLFRALAKLFGKMQAIIFTKYAGDDIRKEVSKYFTGIEALYAENTSPSLLPDFPGKIKYFFITLKEPQSSEFTDDNNKMYRDRILTHERTLVQLKIEIATRERFQYFLANVVEILNAPNATKIILVCESEEVQLKYFIVRENQLVKRRELIADQLDGVSEALEVISQPLTTLDVIVRSKGDLDEVRRIFTEKSPKRLLLSTRNGSILWPNIMRKFSDVIETIPRFSLREESNGDKVEIYTTANEDGSSETKLVAKIKSGLYYPGLLIDVHTIELTVSAMALEYARLYSIDLTRLNRMVKLKLNDANGKIFAMASIEIVAKNPNPPPWSQLKELSARIVVDDKDILMEFFESEQTPALELLELTGLSEREKSTVKQWFGVTNRWINQVDTP